MRELASYSSEHSSAQADELRKALRAQNAATPKPVNKKRGKGRAAVVSWDLGHNPVGRAYVLYKLLEKNWNVDLVGPLWSRYGDSLWQPLIDEELNVHGFHCETLADFVPKAELFAASHVYDVVYVCKPRLPSVYLGSLIKQSSGCPMIIDVDDFELSFFQNKDDATIDELRPHAEVALREPFEELGTRYCQTLVKSADAVTVSNISLRKKFGGHIVRHARDEDTFVVDPEARRAARDRLGIAEHEFAMIFVGTPRPHKGVLEVARALHEINDRSYVFHIVGDIGDKRLKEQLAAYDQARLVFHGNCAFEELPNILCAADLVPLIQDVEHPISQHQIPAKISDSLSLGVPVLATETPPMADLIAQGAIESTDNEGLTDAIQRMRAASLDGSLDRNTVRRYFLDELSQSVNRVRLAHAIQEARSADVELAPALAEMVELMRGQYMADRRRQLTNNSLAELPALGFAGDVADAAKSSSGSLGSTLRRRMTDALPAIMNGNAGYDIAFFWKQNDSGIYGRRSDMIAQYLAASGRVARIVHFDAPKSVHSFEPSFNAENREMHGQQDLILNNLIDRQMGIHDTEVTNFRTYVMSPAQRKGRLLNNDVGKKEQYVRYVREQIAAAGMRAERTYAWFCPVIWEAPELIDKVGFAGVISDLIDDQRAWNANNTYNRKLEKSYRDTLAASDLVFANCDSLAHTMSEYAENIHVVPNGAERFLQLPKQATPQALADIPRPIAGYVGNLRDRIDWLLLQDTVAALPDISFVFIGPADDNPNADSLAKFPNVHMLGVVPYTEVPNYMREFSVGLVPHVNNRLTASMNPLKVYNYFAAGLPIASSEVSNLGDLGSALTVADSSSAFIEAVRASVAASVDTQSTSWQSTMDSIAWDTRVSNILDVMDQTLRSRMKISA